MSDDLISRKAVADILTDPAYPYEPGIERAIMELPSVPAVSLDKLCEWLENNCILSCVSCEHLFGGQWCKQHPELPYRCHRKEHWKDALTKWMEGLTAERRLEHE